MLLRAGRLGFAKTQRSNLVWSGGLVPVLALADREGLRELAHEHLTVPTDKGREFVMMGAALRMKAI
jgi:hypothetical protein